MINLEATYYGVPIFYLAPVLFFGPILIWVLYNIGVGHLIHLPGEVLAKRKREREERESLMAERRKKMGESERVVKQKIKYGPQHWAGQAVVYAVLALPIYLWSQDPEYRLHADNEAQIKLSLSKPGDLKEPCKKLSREELRNLPPQRRGKRGGCGRERFPVFIQVTLDDKTIFAKAMVPSGLSSDGPSLFYEKFQVPAGTHKLTLGMRTSGREEGFDRVLEEEVTLKPTQVLAIGYHMEENRFTLR